MTQETSKVMEEVRFQESLMALSAALVNWRQDEADAPAPEHVRVRHSPRSKPGADGLE